MRRWLLAPLCFAAAACDRPATLEKPERISARENESAAASQAIDANIARERPDSVEIASCANDPRIMVPKTPVTVSGAMSLYDFHIVKTKPEPLARGMNEFMLEVRKGPQPASGVASLIITPTMPDHGHGAQTVPRVTGKKGVFHVEAVDLFMPGVWRIGIRANNAKGETLETGAFYFCIDG